MEIKTNPNGSNQYKPDPRQTLFLSSYLNPKSETFSNALQSALKAGYSQEYAENIMALMPEWLSEGIGDARLLNKATKNLDMALDGLLDDPERGGKPIQMRATELTLKGLQKQKWADQKNIADPNGNPISISIVHYGDTATAQMETKTISD